MDKPDRVLSDLRAQQWVSKGRADLSRILQAACRRTLQFYMTPGSCSTGIHILLEELELPFEVTIINMPADGYFTGAGLSIADAALFYVTFWVDKLGLALPPRCAAHYERMRAPCGPACAA
jgi:hypothetical protein